MSSSVYDVDAVAAEMQSARVRFRGQEYEVGRSAYGIVTAPSIIGDVTEVGAVLQKLPELLQVLAPELFAVLEGAPLTAGEEFALLKVVTEVMNRASRFRLGATQT